MKKLLILFAVCCSLGAYAQDVKVSYRYDLDGFQEGLFGFNEIQYAEIALEGKLKGKSLTISEVRCADGEFSEKEVFNYQYYALTSDTTTMTVLRFYANSISPDSIRVGIIFADRARNYFSIPLKQADPKTYILMETYDSALGVINSKNIKDYIEVGNKTYPVSYTENVYITYPLNTAFPIIAYTTGIDKGFTITDGVCYPSIDFCELRNKKHQNPALWYESSGLQNYVYYVMKFE